jgi:uncharacterized damage-inducible protein DinB
MNQVLLEHLSPEMLSLETSPSGYTLMQHLAHMSEAKKYWGIMFDQSLKDLPDTFPTDESAALTNSTLLELQDNIQKTSQRLLESAEKAPSKGNLPYSSMEVFLMHLITHDAHHRGQIVLILKLSGHTLPNEGALWGLWRQEKERSQT